MVLVKGLVLTMGMLGFLAISNVGGRSVLSPCRPPGITSADMLSDYQYVAQATDPVNMGWRQRLGLFTVPSAQVVIVSDTTTCRRALNAYNNCAATRYSL
jgi:hypothetical protein